MASLISLAEYQRPFHLIVRLGHAAAFQPLSAPLSLTLSSSYAEYLEQD
jgi:hypothetical protein